MASWKLDGQMKICATCNLPIHEADQYVTFAVGSSPRHILNVKLRAEWCGRPTCNNESVQIIPGKTGKIP